MSDIPPKGGGRQPAEIYRLVRERFAPMARLVPLFAGMYSSQGISGNLYIGELSEWLWVPAGSFGPEGTLLSDEEVAMTRDLAVTLKNLLNSAMGVFDLFLEHLDRVQPKPTFTDLVETYLTGNAVLVAEAVASRLVDRAERNPGQTSYSWR